MFIDSMFIPPVLSRSSPHVCWSNPYFPLSSNCSLSWPMSLRKFRSFSRRWTFELIRHTIVTGENSAKRLHGNGHNMEFYPTNKSVLVMFGSAKMKWYEGPLPGCADHLWLWLGWALAELLEGCYEFHWAQDMKAWCHSTASWMIRLGNAWVDLEREKLQQQDCFLWRCKNVLKSTN